MQSTENPLDAISRDISSLKDNTDGNVQIKSETGKCSSSCKREAANPFMTQQVGDISNVDCELVERKTQHDDKSTLPVKYSADAYGEAEENFEERAVMLVEGAGVSGGTEVVEMGGRSDSVRSVVTELVDGIVNTMQHGVMMDMACQIRRSSTETTALLPPKTNSTVTQLSSPKCLHVSSNLGVHTPLQSHSVHVKCIADLVQPKGQQLEQNVCRQPQCSQLNKYLGCKMTTPSKCKSQSVERPQDEILQSDEVDSRGKIKELIENYITVDGTDNEKEMKICPTETHKVANNVNKAVEVEKDTNLSEIEANKQKVETESSEGEMSLEGPIQEGQSSLQQSQLDMQKSAPIMMIDALPPYATAATQEGDPDTHLTHSPSPSPHQLLVSQVMNGMLNTIMEKYMHHTIEKLTSETLASVTKVDLPATDNECVNSNMKMDNASDTQGSTEGRPQTSGVYTEHIDQAVTCAILMSPSVNQAIQTESGSTDMAVQTVWYDTQQQGCHTCESKSFSDAATSPVVWQNYKKYSVSLTKHVTTASIGIDTESINYINKHQSDSLEGNDSISLNVQLDLLASRMQSITKLLPQSLAKRGKCQIKINEGLANQSRTTDQSCIVEEEINEGNKKHFQINQVKLQKEVNDTSQQCIESLSQRTFPIQMPVSCQVGEQTELGTSMQTNETGETIPINCSSHKREVQQPNQLPANDSSEKGGCNMTAVYEIHCIPETQEYSPTYDNEHLENNENGEQISIVDNDNVSVSDVEREQTVSIGDNENGEQIFIVVNKNVFASDIETEENVCIGGNENGKQIYIGAKGNVSVSDIEKEEKVSIGGNENGEQIYIGDKGNDQTMFTSDKQKENIYFVGFVGDKHMFKKVPVGDKEKVSADKEKEENVFLGDKEKVSIGGNDKEENVSVSNKEKEEIISVDNHKEEDTPSVDDSEKEETSSVDDNETEETSSVDDCENEETSSIGNKDE